MRASSSIKPPAVGLAPSLVSVKPRRRMEVDPWQGGSRQINIRATLHTIEQAKAFWDQFCEHRRATSTIVLSNIERLANTNFRPRKKTGYLQPQVPRSLLDRFKSIAGTRRGTELLRRELEHWVSPISGKRKRKGLGGPARRPPRSHELRDRGNKLLLDAKQRGKGAITRYSFDARELKHGVKTLADAMGMTDSEFLSALIERICVEHETKTQVAERASVRDGSAQ